jgi:hypothetical protein
MGDGFVIAIGILGGALNIALSLNNIASAIRQLSEKPENR